MQGASSPSTPVVFRNNAAVFLWVFMGLWTLMLAVFTYVFFRDGSQDAWMPLVLGLFWLFGWAGCAWAFLQPRVRVEIFRGRVLAREMFPWWAREDRCAAGDVSVTDVIEDKDSDGDPYFRCDLRLPDGRILTVAQSHFRPDIEATRAQLLAALAMR